MAKRQITIPIDIRKRLKISTGDHVTFIVDGDDGKMVNSATYAMKSLQNEMVGEAERADINNEEDVMDMIYEMRNK